MEEKDLEIYIIHILYAYMCLPKVAEKISRKRDNLEYVNIYAILELYCIL